MISKEDRFRELINYLYTGDYSVNIMLDGSFKMIEFYNSKGDWIIYYNQKNNWTLISHEYIWSFFEKEYGMKYNDIQKFMKEMLLTHFKIKLIALPSSGLPYFSSPVL